MKRLVGPLVALVALFGLGGSAFAATTVNPSTTPGATDAAASQQTVCATGYAPSSTVTSAITRQVFAAYHIKKKQQQRNYTIDHLVPVSLGGTSDATNLWPQLKKQAKQKATQAAHVRELVCASQVDLAAAQQAFKSNWQAARQTAQTAADARMAAVAQYVQAQKQAHQAAIAQYAATIAQAKQAAAAQAAADAAAAAQQQAQQQQQSCPNGTYVNSAGNTVCSPYQSPSGPPAGATAQCRDGSYSFSQSRSGTCSSHGGVAQWL